MIKNLDLKINSCSELVDNESNESSFGDNIFTIDKIGSESNL